MRRIVLCVLVCVVCAFCVGAEVQEVSKAVPAKFLAYTEVWRVTESRRWTYDDGARASQKLAYDLLVYVNSFNDAYAFEAYDDWGWNLWNAQPPVGRPWNDYTEKRPYVCFAGPYDSGMPGTVVGQLKINRKWLKATGKITGAINAYGWNVNLDGKVKAEYLYTL